MKEAAISEFDEPMKYYSKCGDHLFSEKYIRENSLGKLKSNFSKGLSKQRTRIFIVGVNTRHARALWQDLKKKFPQYKYPHYVSRDASMLDGVNPSETILILLPDYYRNSIINCNEFKWLKENAIEVIHINEEEIK
ncbi:hypothetical protein [Bacillus pumilus]|uniref:hypothetical protein n=1 Tax=Bacillus pumilus TaxID=1408 RepID=UPI0034D437D3